MLRKFPVFLLVVASACAAPALRHKSLFEDLQDNRAIPVVRWSAGRSHYFATLDHVPTPVDLARLRTLGVEPVSFIPDTALVLAGPEDLDPASLGLTRLRHFVPIEKISPSLATPGADPESEPGWFVVQFHPDVNSFVARAIAVQAGWLPRDHSELLPNDLLVQGDPARLLSLAAWDEVAYIFPASRALVHGDPVYPCVGADSQSGNIGQSIPLVGDGWDGPGLGSATLFYAFSNGSGQLPATQVANIVVSAFAQWSQYVQVNFAAGQSPAGLKTIALLFATGSHGDPYPFGPAGGILAHTFYPYPVNPEPIAGDMHFNNANRWDTPSGIDLFSVALHETGHALGLGHSDLPSAVMYPYYHKVTTLTAEDGAAAQRLYASRNSPPPPPTPAGTTPTTAPSNPSTGTPANPTPTNPTPTPTNPTPGAKDTTPPTLRISSPSSTSVSTSAKAIKFKGTASDNAAVASVVWGTSAGATGTASGTANWSTAPIPLYVGTNTITIQATDSSGNASWRTVMVTRH